MKIVSNGKTLEIGGGGKSGGEAYSTEEQVIGTWIDGKPLYRIIFEALVPSISADWQTINSFTDNVDGVMIYSWTIDPTTKEIEMIPTTAGSGFDIQPTKTTFAPGTGIQIYNTGTWYVGRTCRTLLYYTKTTDQATIELPAALTANKAYSDMSMSYGIAATMALGDEMDYNEEV